MIKTMLFIELYEHENKWHWRLWKNNYSANTLITKGEADQSNIAFQDALNSYNSYKVVNEGNSDP